MFSHLCAIQEVPDGEECPQYLLQSGAVVDIVYGLLHLHQCICKLLQGYTDLTLTPLPLSPTHPPPTPPPPPSPTHLLHLLELEVESPEAESGLQLGDGGQGVEELLRRAEREVRVRGPGLGDLRPLIVRWHEVGEQLLHHLPGEVGVVHAEDGRLDVPHGWEPLDLDENVVGSALVQHCH